jgi:hypothetical protein
MGSREQVEVGQENEMLNRICAIDANLRIS